MSQSAAEEIVTQLRREKSRLSAKYHVKSLGLFGSYARGEHTPESDVDLLAEFSEPIGIEIVDLVDELEALLKRQVDLVSHKAIKSRMLPFVEKDLIYV